MSRIPKPFEVYKHFKGNLYQVLNIAEHSETGEALVIYQALYGDYKIYARPLESFMEVLDKTKYPEAKQENRFEQVIAEETTVREEVTNEEELHIDPMVMKFLDADTYEERLQILVGLEHRITDEMITTMAIACDVEVPEGTTDSRFQGLKNCLLTFDRFECNRLR